MAREQALECREPDPQVSTESSSSRLIPYCQIDGEWTLPDHFVRGIWDQLVAEGHYETVFYEGTIKDADDFVRMLQLPSTVVVVALRGSRAAGIAYLNGFSGNQAYGHFCFLRAACGTADEIGREIVAYWTKALGVEFVMGVVPGFNQRAMDFVQRIGFKRVGAVPDMIKSAYRPDRVAANIFYYRGERHG